MGRWRIIVMALLVCNTQLYPGIKIRSAVCAGSCLAIAGVLTYWLLKNPKPINNEQLLQIYQHALQKDVQQIVKVRFNKKFRKYIDTGIASQYKPTFFDHVRFSEKGYSRINDLVPFRTQRNIKLRSHVNHIDMSAMNLSDKARAHVAAIKEEYLTTFHNALAGGIGSRESIYRLSCLYGYLGSSLAALDRRPVPNFVQQLSPELLEERYPELMRDLPAPSGNNREYDAWCSSLEQVSKKNAQKVAAYDDIMQAGTHHGKLAGRLGLKEFAGVDLIPEPEE